MGLLADIGTFGDVAAEQDDAVLSYFLKTEAVDEIESGKTLLVLGRKGSGKTALAKYFSESRGTYASNSISLRDYPWNLHKERRNLGASEIESYVSSWRYLVAVRAISFLLSKCDGKFTTDSQRSSYNFLSDNYGGVNPSLQDILMPKKLKLTKVSFNPSVMGNAIGGVLFEQANGGIAPEVDVLTDVILDNARTMANQLNLKRVFLHFDELDQGLSTLDEQYHSMIAGLVLASRQIVNDNKGTAQICPVVYLRTDIWDELRFSDKNKISQSSAIFLEWDPDSLLDVVNQRIMTKLGDGKSWANLDDRQLMRGQGSPQAMS